MIHDFKTYLKESIWSDMQDRGTGDIDKTEDVFQINNLSPKMMYDYLNERYKPLASRNAADYTASGTTHYVGVNITEHCSIDATYEVRRETVMSELKVWFSFMVSDDVKAINQKMIEELKKRYRVQEESYVFIRPKTGKRTNKLVIDLIDFILDNTEDKPIIERR